VAGLKHLYPLKGIAAPGMAILPFSFVTNGASAVTAYDLPPGWSISAPSTGVYTFTREEGALARCIALGNPAIEDSTGNANDTVRFGDLDAVVTAGTFTVITASSAGTDANLTGPEIHFCLLVSDTSLTR
jgi:hypothetical protein